MGKKRSKMYYVEEPGILGYRYTVYVTKKNSCVVATSSKALGFPSEIIKRTGDKLKRELLSYCVLFSVAAESSSPRPCPCRVSALSTPRTAPAEQTLDQGFRGRRGGALLEESLLFPPAHPQSPSPRLTQEATLAVPCVCGRNSLGWGSLGWVPPRQGSPALAQATPKFTVWAASSLSSCLPGVCARTGRSAQALPTGLIEERENLSKALMEGGVS